MEVLALKYRPKTFEDLVAQDSVKKVLQNQLDTGEFVQGYLFCGSAGCGKTTSARIFANAINKGKGSPIEIDGASNNGVENIRNLIENCKIKPLDSEYKIYIIDEVHMLSIGAFNAMLKVLEEPPKKVIFILCTTDPQKIPGTILSRLQRFQFKRIPQLEIEQRLIDILDKERITQYEEEAISYIAKLADGGLRDALMKLDTVLGYTKNITVKATLECLDISSYDILYNIVEGIYERNSSVCIKQIDELYKNGKDLKLFIKDLNKFILDLCKFEMTHDFDITLIPHDYTRQVDRFVSKCGINFLVDIMDIFSKLEAKIKYESNPKYMIESEVMLLCVK
jgi:DNA polymerase-3 subunit gamma/tau